MLSARAAKAGLADRIVTVNASMEVMPSDVESLDAIWAEGSIYQAGFENGARMWHRFRKTGGILDSSELTWLTNSRPAELEDH